MLPRGRDQTTSRWRYTQKYEICKFIIERGTPCTTPEKGKSFSFDVACVPLCFMIVLCCARTPLSAGSRLQACYRFRDGEHANLHDQCRCGVAWFEIHFQFVNPLGVSVATLAVCQHW